MTRVSELICEIAHPLWRNDVYGEKMDDGWCIKSERMLRLKAYTPYLWEYMDMHNGENYEPGALRKRPLSYG